MIYLLEDDTNISKLVIYGLESQKYEAQAFEKPSDFWRALAERIPELVLLDIMLPEEDGLSVLKKLRMNPATRHVPVIMLTAKNTEYDRVVGLDNGADDFISKPFGMLELIARVRAVLRRTSPNDSRGEYCIGPLYLSEEKHIVRVNGQEIALTFKEFELLQMLMASAGMVLTRQRLMDQVWGIELDRENRTLDVHIRTLRSKLGEAGSLIETVRGVGYKIGEPA